MITTEINVNIIQLMTFDEVDTKNDQPREIMSTKTTIANN